MNKEQFSKKIKNVHVLKNIISICEEVPVSELDKFSKEELIDKAFKCVEDHNIFK